MAGCNHCVHTAHSGCRAVVTGRHGLCFLLAVWFSWVVAHLLVICLWKLPLSGPLYTHTCNISLADNPIFPLASMQTNDILESAIIEALNNPLTPPPLGLKPPSLDCVLEELNRQGITMLPPCPREQEEQEKRGMTLMGLRTQRMMQALCCLLTPLAPLRESRMHLTTLCLMKHCSSFSNHEDPILTRTHAPPHPGALLWLCLALVLGWGSTLTRQTLAEILMPVFWTRH